MTKNITEQPIALITGCSRGIGYATVEILALNGFKIYACVRSIKSCKSLKILASNNSNIIIMELNLKKKASIQKLVGKIQNKETRLDVIVNNASSIIFGPVETVSPEQFHEQFQVNVFGPILLTQELIPLMRKEKKGHIIFLGSTSGVQSHGMYGAYAASKFALEAIGHSLAVNLHPWNIHVSIIELSATSTLIAKKSLKIGSRLKESDNPYLNYTKYTLDFLQTLLMNGTLPKDIAEAIFKVILNPPDELRYFATKKSKDTFERTLKDPSNIHWKKEVKENSNFYD